jgi:hypothetical protein
MRGAESDEMMQYSPAVDGRIPVSLSLRNHRNDSDTAGKSDMDQRGMSPRRGECTGFGVLG